MGEVPPGWSDACSPFACQLLDGLGGAAHRVGIVHRDVTPANVWLVPSLTGELASSSTSVSAKGLDDRIGPHRALRDPRPPSRHAPLPRARADQPAAGGIRRSDLHAVGVPLWEMIAGRRIWKSEGPAVIRRSSRTRPTGSRPSFPTYRRGLPMRSAPSAREGTWQGRFRDADRCTRRSRPMRPRRPPRDVARVATTHHAHARRPDAGDANPHFRDARPAPAPAPAAVPRRRTADGTTKRSSGVEANPKLRPMPTPAMPSDMRGSSGSHAAAASHPGLWRSPAAWSPPSPPSPSRWRHPPPSRARAWIILAVVVAIALAVPAGILAWALHREASPPPPQLSRAASDAGATTTSSAARLGGSPSVVATTHCPRRRPSTRPSRTDRAKTLRSHRTQCPTSLRIDIEYRLGRSPRQNPQDFWHCRREPKGLLSRRHSSDD